ncbi:kinase-like protein [Rhizophagus irregularis]|uniref:Kinase-like protein n=1 Tax=Rhizophagus irregularis TaxID=588596 RepID=A0A2N0NZV4_9GLOM|nr:kinase-like protein [Rhizophagus irregularis]
MSKNVEIKDLNYYLNWLERSIADENIKLYEYSNFKNIHQIGRGAYGNVYRVNCKVSNRVFALKSFVDSNDKQTIREVIKELKLHRSVDYHENIIRLYGITSVEFDTIQKYSFVLEYADSGTLNTYLNEHFNELNWTDKYKLALQLASAIGFLHGEDIIHRDLHGNNILIHQKNIKLADFGLSKKIVEASSNTSVLGIIPYVDPKSFDDKNYKLNKKSDVYSVGVLLWQISSGYRPFHEDNYGPSLMLSILNGRREKIINGTPVKYSNLYRECWGDELNSPNIQEIISTLKSISSLIEIDAIIDHDIDEKKETHSMEDEINPELSKETIDLNNELISNDELKILSYSNKEIRDSTNEIISKGESNIIMKYENHRMASSESPSNASAPKQVNRVTKSSNDFIEFLNLDKIIAYVIEKHDKGATFDQVQQLISKHILQINQATDELIKWLLKNQDKTQHIWFLGLFYYYNIGVEENVIKAFELFSKVADDNYPIAQVYLAKCYYDGYGTEFNLSLAFYWYQKSAENGSVVGQFYLGNCYECGIGIVENENKSFYWYNTAAKNGNETAKLYLAHCYRLGKGVEKDEVEAFKYYKRLAKQENADAQLQVGNCFYFGIGTKLDKIQAKCWYEKATNNGNIIAKNILKKHYNVKMRVEKNKSKKIKFYKILFHKSLSQLGFYCVGKLLLKTNYEKSFYYFQKAAENGCKFAQFNLGGCYQLGDGVRKDLRNIKAFELAKIIAEKGYSDAQYLLGEYYIYGEGVDKDENKAFELFNKLAKDTKYSVSGKKEIKKQKEFEYSKIFVEDINIRLNYELGNCYNEGVGTEINKTKAFESYKIAAEEGNCFAQNSLGFLYECGEGVEKNLEKAISWYNKAAENGNEIAQYNLGNCYKNGRGVEKNEAKAFEYYKKSADQEYLNAQFQLGNCYIIGVGTEDSYMNVVKELK